MSRQWIAFDASRGNAPDAPPIAKRAWFWSAGNARNPSPHLRLTMPILENVSDCTHWMLHIDGDKPPAPPG